MLMQKIETQTAHTGPEMTQRKLFLLITIALILAGLLSSAKPNKPACEVAVKGECISAELD
jgi:hypothetical protein